MGNNEISFDGCKTITEVYAMARTLKENGEDPKEVNTLATKRKRELISSGNENIQKLVKILPKASTRQNGMVSSIMMDISDINSGVIKITRTNKVII